MNYIIAKRWIICMVIVVYLLTAIFSTGYHHPDEHFQLIEFAGLKLGWNAATDLAWEYEAKIRPALQPAIACGVIGALRCVGMDNPYSQALALRLLSAILALCSIGCFIKSFAHATNGKHRIAYVLLSFLLWFLPAINVRFSSEAWAGSFFLLALSFIYGEKRQTMKSCLFAGVMLGASFECRFQMALAIIGVLGWIVWIGKWNGRQWMSLLAGGLLAVACGVMIDCWFYGAFVFTPFHYFQVNILQDVASSFGVSPWSFYVLQILERPTWIIGTGILLSIVNALLYKWKNPVVWYLIPFVLVHSIIPHKELRFLFPMVNFIPLLLIWGYERIIVLMDKWACRLWISLFCVVNMGGVLMMTCKPAGYGNVRMMQYLTCKYADTAMPLYATPLGNPFLESSFLPIHFYQDHRVSLYDYLEDIEKPSMFKVVKMEHCAAVVMNMEKDRRKYLESHGFTEEFRSIPIWTECMNRFYNVYDEERTLILYFKK